MARRRSDIAGLAALAALGYGLYNSKKKEEEARKKPAAAETPAAKKSSYDEETVFTGPMEPKTTTPRQQPKKPASEPVSEPESMAEKYSKTDTGDETARLAKRYPKPASRPSAPDTGDETSRLARRYAAPAASRSPSREELISQIPTGGMPTVTDGERVSGSEFDRNVANTMAALGPGKLAGIGAIGMEMRGAEAARKAALAKSERSAKLAEELRSAQQPTSFSSTRSAVDRNPTKSTRYKEDEAGVEFKRGGKASSKPAAKGWGKARGARQAKYY